MSKWQKIFYIYIKTLTLTHEKGRKIVTEAGKTHSFLFIFYKGGFGLGPWIGRFWRLFQGGLFILEMVLSFVVFTRGEWPKRNLSL